jgi:uncharacterized protein
MDNNTNYDLVFNVAQLLKEHVGSTRRLNFESPSLTLYDENGSDGDTLEAQNVKGNVKVTRLSDGVLVQGDVKADVQLQCSRCLDDISLPVDARLEEQFQPTVDVETGHAITHNDSEEDDTLFKIDANHMMDLTEPVRQALLVAIPMRPLCREDCKGLCPECGANLNYIDCGHHLEASDSRWDALRALNIADFPVDKNAN